MQGRLFEHGALSDHLQRHDELSGQRMDQHRERGEFLLGAERRLGRGVHALQCQLSELPRLESAHCERIRSEEHTSELQSHSDLVCRLLLEKKNKTQY